MASIPPPSLFLCYHYQTVCLGISSQAGHELDFPFPNTLPPLLGELAWQPAFIPQANLESPWQWRWLVVVIGFLVSPVRDLSSRGSARLGD